MRDIVLDDIAHEQGGEIDAHHGIDQIEPVGTSAVEVTGEHKYYLIDDPMEHEGGYGSKEADNQREDDHEHLLADMLHPPLMQPLKP